MSKELDIERLKRAILIVDEIDPGIFNDIAIDDEAAQDVAERIAVVYAEVDYE